VTTPPYAVREAWVRFKEQALTSGEAPSDAYALAAIEKWASHEAGSRGGPARPLREALAASVAGAALVDAAIEKLAAEGRYTAEEREFLLDVNAEAAIRDLRGLLKTSSAFGDALRSPTARGALIGTAIGGSVGAWKDDDNRLRGALTYALPGAAIGSVVGHGYGTWAKARQLAGEEQARRVLDEMHATDDFNVRRIEGQEWAKAQDAAHAKGVRDAAADAQAATDDFNVRKIQGQQWAKAQDAAHAVQAGAPAAEKLKSTEDAKRWHQNLFDAANMFLNHSDKATKEYARHLLHHIHTYRDSIIEHATDNPQSVHKVLVQAAGVDGGQKTLNAILNHARMLHKNGN
jgi:hypothetical protein